MPDLVPDHMGLSRRVGRASHDGNPQQRASLMELLCGNIRRDVHHGAELWVVAPEEVEALLSLILGDMVVELQVCSAAGGVRLAAPRAAGRDWVVHGVGA